MKDSSGAIEDVSRTSEIEGESVGCLRNRILYSVSKYILVASFITLSVYATFVSLGSPVQSLHIAFVSTIKRVASPPVGGPIILLGQNEAVLNASKGALKVDEADWELHTCGEAAMLRAHVRAVMEETRAVNYKVENISTVVRTSIEECMRGLVFPVGHGSQVFALDPVFSFLIPFLARHVSKECPQCVLVYAVDDGMSSAFQPQDDGMMGELWSFLSLNHEHTIDQLCTQRVRKNSTFERDTCSFNHGNIFWERGYRSLPCTADEVRIMQRAAFWKVSFGSLQEHFGELISEYIYPLPVGRPRSLERSQFSHRQLLFDLCTILNVQSQEFQSFRSCPVNPVMQDAGSCWRNQNGVLVCLPTLIIVGVQKAGTSELGLWLDANPHFHRQGGGRETHYFDCVGRGRGKGRASCARYRDVKFHRDKKKMVFNKKVKPGLFRWSDFNNTWDAWVQYTDLGRPISNRKAIFEKSPAYFDLAEPMDMMRVLPSVKLVFILRNPVERVHSGYFQECLGRDKTQSCSEENFSRDIEIALSMGQGPLYRALKCGHYAEHLAGWLDAYPASQILVIFRENFVNNPNSTLRDIETLALNDKFPHHRYHPEKAGKYWVVNSQSKAFKPTHKSAMSESSRRLLEAYYKPWRRKLRKMLQGLPSLIRDKELPDWLTED